MAAPLNWRMLGHMELASTSCPGEPAMRWLHSLGRVGGALSAASSSVSDPERLSEPEERPKQGFMPPVRRGHRDGRVELLQRLVGRVRVDGYIGPETLGRVAQLESALSTWRDTPKEF